MSQKTTINRHVFHEFYTFIARSFEFTLTGDGVNPGPFYTNPGIPRKNLKYFHSRYPLKITSKFPEDLGAIYGYADTLNTRPIEFETEEDILKFYKTKFFKDTSFSTATLSESDYEALGSEKICKNYFVVPSSIFYKYKSFFNGMVKGVKIKFSHELSCEGQHEKINECQCSSSSSESSASSFPDSNCCHSETHPNHPCGDSGQILGSLLSPGSFLNTSERIDSGLKPFFKIEGPDLKDIDFLFYDNLENSSSSISSNFNFSSSYSSDSNDLISIKSLSTLVNLSEGEEEVDDCCYCPPCDIIFSQDEEIRNRIPKYICKRDFKASLKVNIDYNSSKIFEDEQFENRLPGFGYRRSINFKWDDSEPQDALSFRMGLGPITLYKDNWVFNTSWKNELFRPLSFFNSNLKKFPENSTFINDPLFLKKGSGFDYILPTCEIDVRTSNLSLFDIESALTAQKEKKQTENFGTYSISIDGNKSETGAIVFRGVNIRIYYELQHVFYLKSKDQFLCFVNLIVSNRSYPSIYSKTWLDENFGSDATWSVDFDPNQINKITKEFLYTTDDSIMLCTIQNNCEECPFPNSTRSGDDYEKKQIPIKIGDFETSFEVFVQKNEEDFFEINQNGQIQSNYCEGGSLPGNGKFCEKVKVTRKSKPTLEFEIEGWTKDDFSDTNIFPPKVNIGQ